MCLSIETVRIVCTKRYCLSPRQPVALRVPSILGGKLYLRASRLYCPLENCISNTHMKSQFGGPTSLRPVANTTLNIHLTRPLFASEHVLI